MFLGGVAQPTNALLLCYAASEHANPNRGCPWWIPSILSCIFFSILIEIYKFLEGLIEFGFLGLGFWFRVLGLVVVSFNGA